MLGRLTVILTVFLFWIYFYPLALVFVRVWHTDLLQKLNSCGISGEAFRLILQFLSKGRLAVVLDGKRPQEYSANACIFQGCVLGLCFSYITLITLLMILSVMLLSMLVILLFTLWILSSELWQQLQFFKLNLTYQTLWTGTYSGLFISMRNKSVCFIDHSAVVLLI